MKKEIKKPIKKVSSKSKEIEIDVHNDVLMVSLGLRVPVLIPRDKSIWSKTSNERRILQNVRYSSGNTGHFSAVPNKRIPVRGKLIIYLKKNSKYPKTTYSTECWQHEIPEIIGNYRSFNKKINSEENVVLKYAWNGQTYTRTLPFWR